MKQKSLDDIFSKYIRKKSIFKDKDVLTAFFEPAEILHRDKQIEELANIFSPVLKNALPSNTFIYGSTGTGKTLITKHVLEKLNRVCKENALSTKIVYMNCKMKRISDTEYRIIAQLTRELGEEVPFTGLPTDEIYNKFFEKLEELKSIVIIVLDEIDALVKKIGDNFLYNLIRINSDLKETKVCVVGISNDLIFIDNLDARVRSSLSEEELIFPPYNALELKDILEYRAKEAFHENVVSEAIISKCAALAAQEHGDARRALDLLRVAGELCERENSEKIKLSHVDIAREKIERDRIIEAINLQPKHSQFILYSAIKLFKAVGNPIATGELYNTYKELAEKIGLEALTQRRVSDLIAELDMLGIINAQVISKGRYGRTRNISINLSRGIIENIEKNLSHKFM